MVGSPAGRYASREDSSVLHSIRSGRRVAALLRALVPTVVTVAVVAAGTGSPASASSPDDTSGGLAAQAGPQRRLPDGSLPPAPSVSGGAAGQAAKQRAALDAVRAQAAQQPLPAQATASYQVSPAVVTYLSQGLGLPVSSGLLTGLRPAGGALKGTFSTGPAVHFTLPARAAAPAFGRTELAVDTATGTLTVTAAATGASLSVRITHAATTTLAGGTDLTSRITMRVPVPGATVTVSGQLTNPGGPVGVSAAGSLADDVVLRPDAATLDKGSRVTLDAGGVRIAGTAELGPAAHRLRVGVSGRLTRTDTWSLTVDSAAASTALLPGLTLGTAMTGTVTGGPAGVTYDVHATASGTWRPLAGVSLGGASEADGAGEKGAGVRFSNALPRDGTMTAPGVKPGNPWVAVTGTVRLAAGAAGIVAARGTLAANLATGAAALTAQQDGTHPLAAATLGDARFGGLLTVWPGGITGSVTGTGVLTTTPARGQSTLDSVSLRMGDKGTLVAEKTAAPSAVALKTAAAPAAEVPEDAGDGTTYTLSRDAYALITQKLHIPLGSSPTVSGTRSGPTLTLTVGSPGALPLTMPAGMPTPVFGATTVTVDEATNTVTLTASASAGITGTLRVSIANAATTTLSGGADLTATVTLSGVPFVNGSSVTLTGTLSYTGGTLNASLTGSLDADLSVAGGAVVLKGGASVSIATGTGLSIDGTALVGPADAAYSVTVNGTLTDLKNWSLSVTSTPGQSWQPVAGLTLYPNLNASITDTDGTIGFDLSSTDTGSWSPAAGASLSFTRFQLSNQEPPEEASCPSVGDGDVWLDLRGSFSYPASGMPALTADACLDLTSHSYRISTTATGTLLPGNPTFNLTRVALSVSGSVTTRAATFTITGSATAAVTVPNGGSMGDLTAVVSFGTNGVLAGVEIPDLSVLSSSLAGSGVIYISSNQIATFKPSDYGLPSTPFPATVPLLAGVNIAYSYTVASLPSNLTAVLSHLHVTIPSGTSILAVAQVSTSGLSASLDVHFGTEDHGAQLVNQNGVAAFLDDVTLGITLGGDTSVSVAGAGYFEMPAMWQGGSPTRAGVVVKASLSVNTLSPVITLGIVNWDGAFGVPDLHIDNLSVSVAPSIENPTVSVTASGIRLPGGWPQAIGIAAGAQISLNATVSLAQPLLTFSIAPPQGGAVALTPLAVAYADQIAAGRPLSRDQQDVVNSLQIGSASFYLAPFGGKTASGLTILPGLAVSFHATIDNVPLDIEGAVGVAPPSLSVNVSVGSYRLGPVTMTQTSFTMNLGPSQLSFGFSGGFSDGTYSYTGSVSLMFGSTANNASINFAVSGLPSFVQVTATLSGRVSVDSTGVHLAASAYGRFVVGNQTFGTVQFGLSLPGNGLSWSDTVDSAAALVQQFVRAGASIQLAASALKSLNYSDWDIFNAIGAAGYSGAGFLEAVKSAFNWFSTTYYDIWTYTAPGVPLVLDVQGGSRSVNAQVLTYVWNDGSNQEWAFQADPHNPGWYEVVNRNSGQCLTVKNGSTAQGAPLVQYPCMGDASQLWYFGSIVLNTAYGVTNYRSRLVMEVQGAYPYSGGTVDQWGWGGGSHQKFLLTNASNS
jgi:Ricin-type beta-trefoil lectin domain-like